MNTVPVAESFFGLLFLMLLIVERQRIIGLDCEKDLFLNVTETEVTVSDSEKETLANEFVKEDLSASCGIEIPAGFPPYSPGKIQGDIDGKMEDYQKKAKQVSAAGYMYSATAHDWRLWPSKESFIYHYSTVIHELMHAVGFFHEQSRHDRDQYVEILWNNIESGQEDQFEKYRLHSTIRNLGIGYDYGSIMHYGKYAFSKNARPTIRAKPGKPGGGKIGQRKGFSSKDIEKVKKLYNCPSQTGQGTTATTPSSKTSTGTGSQTCEDANQWCLFLKIFGGVCRNNKKKQRCLKTCNACNEQPATITTTTKPPCIDNHRHCNYWSRRGYCRRLYVGYMRKTCKKACGICN